MARRVYLGSTGLFVGPAGVDCTTAAQNTLLFSSSGLAYNGIYMIGQSSGWSGGSMTIPFGMTFSAVPRSKYFVLDPSYGALTAQYNCNSAQEGEYGFDAGMIVVLQKIVSTTSLVFKINVLDYGGGTRFSTTPSIVYIVFTN